MLPCYRVVLGEDTEEEEDSGLDSGLEDRPSVVDCEAGGEGEAGPADKAGKAAKGSKSRTPGRNRFASVTLGCTRPRQEKWGTW